MTSPDRVKLFDSWAPKYDDFVRGAHGFPFEGYDAVLDEILRQAGGGVGRSALDLGTGTGALAERFLSRGFTVWGADFSPEMLVRAAARVPDATLVRADLLDRWPATLDRRFDRIVSAYVFHEFEPGARLELIGRLVRAHLEPGGRLVVGDVAFSTATARDEMRERYRDSWDDTEHYMAADEIARACPKIGVHSGFTPMSMCGGVFLFGPS